MNADLGNVSSSLQNSQFACAFAGPCRPCHPPVIRPVNRRKYCVIRVIRVIRRKGICIYYLSLTDDTDDTDDTVFATVDRTDDRRMTRTTTPISKVQNQSFRTPTDPQKTCFPAPFEPHAPFMSAYPVPLTCTQYLGPFCTALICMGVLNRTPQNSTEVAGF